MAKNANKDETTEKANEEHKFTKEQLLLSKTFKRSRDIIDALFDENKVYTFEEANSSIEKFRKGKVN